MAAAAKHLKAISNGVGHILQFLKSRWQHVDKNCPLSQQGPAISRTIERIIFRIAIIYAMLT
jgi:hypothetical protein